MAKNEDIARSVARFGEATKAKFSALVEGQPEDQLRGPIDTLIQEIGEAISSAALRPKLLGETQINELKTRPDFAVTRQSALIGHVELKAPGKGCDPRTYTNEHDKAQWAKLKPLPNLIYSDGNGFMLFRDGKKEAEAYLTGDVRTAGRKLVASDDLERLFTSFLSWEPIAPKTPAALAKTAARLCRLLRDQVREQMDQGADGLTALHEDIRKLMFPEWTEVEFADGYAQSVTFGLLMAKARGLSLEEGPGAVAKKLKASSSLIGAALGVLTDGEEEERLSTSLGTMTRVLEAVDWATVSGGDPEAWLYFYEDFLKAYDPALRKKTGSYYTPPEVVSAMVRLTEEALVTRFGQARGFASAEVKVADPAVGTGTFLLGILRRIAEQVAARDGEGAVAGEVEAALSRMIGFELQFGPFAVAQLRMLAEVAELTGKKAGDATDATLRLHVADTLADPDEAAAWIPSSLKEIGESRKQANDVKRSEPITVVIGNPPYKVAAKALGGWVADRGALPAPIDDWMPLSAWGVGSHAKHLHNLYVYFWRWAAWKVFGGDPFRSGTDDSEAVFTDERGVVCFITAAGFLNGPGFQKMRAELRRQADEVWVIDCSPEGFQPAVSTRIFQGVQQPVCIVIAARREDGDREAPARVLFRELPEGKREEKFEALSTLSLEAEGWSEVSTEGRASFLPAGRERWASYPELERLFDYDGSGVMPGRTWPIAPDKVSLEKRWAKLTSMSNAEDQARWFKPHANGDRTIDKTISSGVHGHEHRTVSVRADDGSIVSPIRYAFRSFDRQWIIPDKRLLNRENPTLWERHSKTQVYLTALQAHSPNEGPALSVCGLIPDLHHYKGSFGGRFCALWADAEATTPNVRPALLDALAEFGLPSEPEDVFAYVAGVCANPRYTERFAPDLRQPGLRVPITADEGLFKRAAGLGREVIWLHSFGERFADPCASRPADAPRAEGGPTIPKGGAIPTTKDGFPDEMRYAVGEGEGGIGRLYVGTGYLDRVSPAVWSYEVSGMRVLTQWFSYRKKDRSRPVIGDRAPPSPLNDIQPDHWLPEYTSELVNVCHVLTRLVALEAAQAEVLDAIADGACLGVDELGDALRPVT